MASKERASSLMGSVSTVGVRGERELSESTSPRVGWELDKGAASLGLSAGALGWFGSKKTLGVFLGRRVGVVARGLGGLDCLEIEDRG